MQPVEQRLGNAAFAVVLGAVALVTYAPALTGDFLWDDLFNIVENPHLTDGAGLARIWLEPGATTQYYPLVFSSFWLEHQLFGASPLPYHLVNVGLHALVAWLLAQVLAALGIPGARFAGLVFALHPVHVESVAWISERKNVLSGALYAAAALIYIRSATDLVRARTVKQRALASVALIALFLGALLAKPTVVTLPASLGIVAMWHRGRATLRGFAPLFGMLAIGLPFALLAVSLERGVGAEIGGFRFDLSLLERFVLGGRALWFYLSKLAVPIELAFIYPRFGVGPGAWPLVLYPLGWLAGLLALGVLRPRLGAGPLVAALTMSVTLAPFLGFFEVYFYRFSWVADHWQYLSSMGPIALVSAALARLAGSGSARLAAVARAVGTAAVLALAAASFAQARQYASPEALWSHVLERNPNSALAHNNLGYALVAQDRHDEAFGNFERAAALDPDDASAHNNLGLELLRQERFPEAIDHFERARELEPNHPQYRRNLRDARQERRHWQQNLKRFLGERAVGPEAAPPKP